MRNARNGGEMAPKRAATAIALAVALLAPVGNASAPPARPPVFSDAAARIFAARCVRCHGPRDAKNGLRLDSYEGARRGGESGPVIIPGDGSSLLLQKIEGKDQPSMPPRRPLSRREIAAIAAWIVAGARL